MDKFIEIKSNFLLSEEQEILTKRGCIKVKELTVGDVVIGLMGESEILRIYNNKGCVCETNEACTKEEDGNGDMRDYCWKCHDFRK